jgi:hypothetical protein
VPPAGDHIQRQHGPTEPRQALRSASAGDDANLDFRQPNLPARRDDTATASQRQLKPAAQRRAVQRCNNRLGAGFQRRGNITRRGRFGWGVELANIGAGDKGAALTGEHPGTQCRVSIQCIDGRDQRDTYVVGKCVNGWRIHENEPDFAVFL